MASLELGPREPLPNLGQFLRLKAQQHNDLP